MSVARRMLLLMCALACVSEAAPATAQSALDRTPNLTGGWTGTANSLHFNFLHRFSNSGAPQNQVSNRPTFLLAYRAPIPLLVGAQYATRSDIVARYPNEWEGFARYAWLDQDVQGIADVATQLSYNLAAESVDGELVVARRAGPVRIMAATRLLSNAFGDDETRAVIGGGVAVRIHQWVSLAADAATLIDRGDDEEAAWGAALQLAIPYTPHSVSIQATNTNTATLHGTSRGGVDRRYGFEFTVPIALARYFGRPPQAPPAPPAASTTAASIRNLMYMPGRIEITAGSTIVWRNNDQVEHTVSAPDNSWDSGKIPPGATWQRTFTQPGTYEYICTPHPFMKGTIIVRAAP